VEDIDYLKEEEEIVFPENEIPGEEMENYSFCLKMEKDDKIVNLYFGLRSFHNGYYPVSISVYVCLIFPKLIKIQFIVYEKVHILFIRKNTTPGCVLI
jgi:hypothetical protein